MLNLRGSKTFRTNFDIIFRANLIIQISSFFSAEDDEVLMDLAQELNDGTPVRMEDCEAFKCEVVKYGKQAYEIVSKALEDRRRK